MTIDDLNPGLADNLTKVDMPIVAATAESLAGCDWLVEQPDQIEVEIVRWPAHGWRPIVTDSGGEAGTTEGDFLGKREGDILYGSNVEQINGVRTLCFDFRVMAVLAGVHGAEGLIPN